MAKKNEEQKQELNLEETKTQNTELYEKLTKKNKDYIFQINGQLEELNYDSTKKEYVINNMLTEIIDAQKDSIPARKLYGTPTERANEILGIDVEIPEGEQEKSPTWMLYMDGALLLGGLFAIVNGITSMRSSDPAGQIGLLQVILNFVLGGAAVLVLIRYAPKPGETKGMLKYIGATVGVMLVWVLLMTIFSIGMMNVINPIIPGEVVIGIGVVALVAKWYLKKRLDIKGTLI